MGIQQLLVTTAIYSCWPELLVRAAGQKLNSVGSLRDQEVACSASHLRSLNFESCVWNTDTVADAFISVKA